MKKQSLTPVGEAIQSAPEKHGVRRTVALLLGAGGLGGIFRLAGTYFACSGEAFDNIDVVKNCIEVSNQTFVYLVVWARQNSVTLFCTAVSIGMAIKLILPSKPRSD